MKRLLALVVALAMVGGALYLRGQWDDDVAVDDGAAGPVEPVDRPEGTPRLVCARELAEVCRGADAKVTVEDISTTFERLTTTADPGVDAWLVYGPWPEMVDVEREQGTLEPLFTGETRALARTRFVAVGPDEPTPCDWRCIGDRANQGELRIGLPEPTSGLGMLIVGAATVGYFGNPDVASNDFDQPFEDWLSSLVAEARVLRSPALSILQSGALLDVALSTDVEARPLFDGASPDRKEGLALLYPEPVASVDVVLAGSTDALGDALARPLLDAGWTEPDERPTGLPNPGVLLALRDRL